MDRISEPFGASLARSTTWSLAILPLVAVRRKWISPSTMRPGRSTSLRIERAVTLLPQPLSPTIPSVFPGYKSKLTPSTAFTVPSSWAKYVFRSRTDRSGVPATVIPSHRSGRPASGQRAVDHRDERDDVEHGQAGLPLDIRAVGRHVGALQHERSDVRMLSEEPPRDAHVLLARGVDVEHQLVAEEHPGELLLRLHPGDGDRNVATDVGGREVFGREGRRVHGHDSHPPSGREQAVDEGDQQEARREHGHAHGGRQGGLERHEESAVGGDGAHAFALERLGRLDERRQQTGRALADDEIRVSTGHPLIADGERERRRVAHVADDAREARVEHEDPYAEPILVDPAPHTS